MKTDKTMVAMIALAAGAGLLEGWVARRRREQTESSKRGVEQAEPLDEFAELAERFRKLGI